MIYLDSSALIKLIAPEAESKTLSEWIRANWEQARMTSGLAHVDVLRGFREVGPAAEDLASIVLSKIEQVPVSREVLEAAAELPMRLDTVGAVHVGSARTLGDGLFAYVSYDSELLAAAAQAGLPTAQPGAGLPIESTP